MKTEHFNRLCEIAEMPHISPRSQLIVARRVVRYVLAEERAFAKGARQLIKKAKQNLPFTKDAIAGLESAKSEMHKNSNGVILEVGTWLANADALLTLKYGFEGLCDVLEVNPVHRQQADEYLEASHAVSAIAFVAGLEESAARLSGRNSEDFKDGPVFNAFLEVMMDFAKSNPESIPDPTAPGGPLYGLPVYYRQPDGKLARQSAPLVVHDANGSRVVTRKIEVQK